MFSYENMDAVILTKSAIIFLYINFKSWILEPSNNTVVLIK